MIRFKTIKSKKIEILRFRKNHITKEYISWLNNKNLLKFSEQKFKKHTKKTCLKYLGSIKKTNNYFLAIQDAENNKHIGNITIYLNKNYRTAEISLLIGSPVHQGRGFGTMAWIMICNFLFKKLKVRKISAGTLVLNKPMLKIFKASNMYYEARRRKHAEINGIQIDLVIYSIFRDQWLQKIKKY